MAAAAAQADALGLSDCSAAALGGVDVASDGAFCGDSVAHARTQTASPPQADAAAQSVARRDAGEQSDPLGAFAGGVSEGSHGGELERAMAKVAPLMERELRANLSSRAQTPGGVGGTGVVLGADEAASELHALRDAEAADKEGLAVTALDWSSTGSVLAVAYGRFDIEGWCEHRGRVSVWNLARREVDARKPDSSVALPSCVMSVACCPAHPALVAAGTFDGEVCVADLSAEGGEDAQDALRGGRGLSRVSAASHREPVVALQWAFDIGEAAAHSRREEAYRLVSLGGDGRVLVWRWTDLRAPLYGYELWHPHPQTHKVLRWGGTALALEGGGVGKGGSNSRGLVVGTEGGAVFRCHMTHTGAMEDEFRRKAMDAEVSGREDARMRSPVQQAHEAHTAAVSAVAKAPHAPQLFASAGADGALKLHHANALGALKVLEPAQGALHCAAWSPSRAMVLAAGADDGRVHVYDLAAGATHPTAVIDACGKKAPVRALAFNARFPELLAAAGAAGEVKVYELAEGLHRQQEGEAAALRRWAADAAGA